ncbi:SigE family RNA polymerase sigma factor [Dactylosporangium sp. NPDC005572]|uniref:SigE family RNA polymerase sigma factor n=1 Tax=Dactylosporangium sp. NPDC005572 TaxID=3156889 RepID=UPI0033AF6182
MSVDGEFVDYARVAAPRLRRTAYLLCQDWHLAQDLTQTALAKLFVHWGRIHRRDSPDAYARKVLLRVFLDHQRRSSSHEVVVDRVADGPAPGGQPELRLTLIEALSRIPARDRAILVLRYWEDQSIDTVADLLGVSVPTVKSQSARGLSRLRSLLGADDEALLALRD